MPDFERAAAIEAIKRDTLGLITGERYVDCRDNRRVRRQASARARPDATHQRRASNRQPRYVSALVRRSPMSPSRVVTAEPRFPRSTLLHGMVHGVPVAGPSTPRSSTGPRPDDLSVELGHHGDDVAATVAADGLRRDRSGGRAGPPSAC